MKHIKSWIYAAVAWLILGVSNALANAGMLVNTYTRYAGLAKYLNLYSQFTYDANLLLKAAALVAATANGTLVLDVGNGLVDDLLVIDVTALEIDSNDESYEIVLQGSNTAAFATAADIYALASVTLGDKASARLAAGVLATGTDLVAGRYVLPFRNELNGTTFRYLRIKTIVVGTIGTGINYSAWIGKR